MAPQRSNKLSTEKSVIPNKNVISGRGVAPASRVSFINKIFGKYNKNYTGTAIPPKNAEDFIDQEISDKEALNRKKYNSFRAGNPDMFISYDEWDMMVTNLGTMGDTIEKFGYEAFKQLIQDLHDEGTSLSKSDMSYVINESLSIMRNSDRVFTQEDAMDLLRERIYLEYGNI